MSLEPSIQAHAFALQISTDKQLMAGSSAPARRLQTLTAQQLYTRNADKEADDMCIRS
jgi:hypothetical protein